MALDDPLQLGELGVDLPVRRGQSGAQLGEPVRVGGGERLDPPLQDFGARFFGPSAGSWIGVS